MGEREDCGGDAVLDSPATKARYTSPAGQLANLRGWNRLLGHLWADDELERASRSIPNLSNEELLVPLTLCWTLGTLASTIDAKLVIMRHVYGDGMVVVTGKFKPDRKHTSIVVGGPEFKPDRLWWELIDLGANRRKAPNQVPPETAAGSEIFDVICQHPIYVSQQDGGETPYLDLPGLSVKVRGMSGPDTPDAAGGSTGQVDIGVHWEGSVYPDHAEPVREPMQHVSRAR